MVSPPDSGIFGKFKIVLKEQRLKHNSQKFEFREFCVEKTSNEQEVPRTIFGSEILSKEVPDSNVFIHAYSTRQSCRDLLLTSESVPK